MGQVARTLPNLNNMPATKKHIKGVPSKGDRLKWTPLKEVKSIRLTPDLIKGKAVFKKINTASHNVLVP